jgi:tRNA threonylcarbamoyladenosine modification (KEOPS) complex Cgi121 subunit
MTERTVEELTEGLRVWKASVSRGSAQSVLEGVVSRAAGKGVDVLVMDADLVFGTDHVRAALYRARRSMREGRNVSDSLTMETLLYASAERQLSSAIKKMAVGGDTEELVIAQLTPGGFDPEDAWSELPARATDATPEQLARFGLTKQEILTVRPGLATELVLEKVAAVDIFKK